MLLLCGNIMGFQDYGHIFYHTGAMKRRNRLTLKVLNF